MMSGLVTLDASQLGPFVRASPSAVYVFDPSSLRIVEANPAAAAFYGYPLEEFLDLTLDELVAAPGWEVAARAIERGDDPDTDNIHVDARGNPIPVWVHAVNVTVDGRDLRIINVENIANILTSRVHAEQQLRTIVQTIGSILRLRDPYTDRHQIRVANLAGLIATELGLSTDEQVGVVTGAMIHDIGKIAVPGEILTYPGRLEPAAMELLRKHPQTGHDLLIGADFPWPIAEMVLQHHERMDGSGYPNRIRGETILPASRIIAVADVAEAIASHRPYRPAYPLDVALSELERGAGTSYDPDVVRAALNVMTTPDFRLHPEAFGGP